MRSLSNPRQNPLERKESHGETTKQSEGAADSGDGGVGLSGGSRRRGLGGAGAGAGGGGGGVDEGGVGSHGQVARGDDIGARGGAAGRGNDGRVGGAGRRHGARGGGRGRAGSAARDLEGERVLEDAGVLLPEDLDAVDGLVTVRLVDRPAVLSAAAVISLCRHIV